MPVTATSQGTSSGHRYNVPAKSAATYTATTATANAHVNLSGIDLIQVINQGGKVVWSLSSTGVVTLNPVNPSTAGGKPIAQQAQWFGPSFVAAHSVGNTLDVYQIHDGSKVVYHVDSTGTAFTP